MIVNYTYYVNLLYAPLSFPERALGCVIPPLQGFRSRSRNRIDTHTHTISFDTDTDTDSDL